MAVSRRLASATRAITNRGEVPRFIGEIPSFKAPNGKLSFDSIPALECAIYLEWSPRVALIEFEPEWFEFPETEDLPAVRCLPDFRATLDTGEFRMIEAKSSRERLSPKAVTQLEIIRQHFARRGIEYDIVYRSELKKNGFIDTISLLRRFGRLSFPPDALARALTRLNSGKSADLETWVGQARQVRVPLSVLHHLLYHQRLPLIYRKVLHPEIRHWRE